MHDVCLNVLKTRNIITLCKSRPTRSPAGA